MMEDKLIANNVLSLIKGLDSILYHGTIESSTPEVRAVFEKNLSDCLKMQDEVYKFMESCGWYKQSNVEEAKINKVKKKYEAQQSQ